MAYILFFSSVLAILFLRFFHAFWIQLYPRFIE